jgi:peptidoglycan/xylan/chitin deacetylase (PgdA/CDA1 family)
VALPGKGNRTAEVTVTPPAQRATNEAESVTVDEPTAKPPETLAAPAGQPAADDDATAALPGLSAATENDQATTAPSERAAKVTPEDARTGAEPTIPIPATSDPDEATIALQTPPKATGSIASAPHSAAPTAEPAPADATVAIPLGPVSLPAERTVALPPAVPAREPAPARHPGHLLLGRRRLLLTGAGVAAAAIVGGIAVQRAGRQPDAAGSAGRPGNPTAVTTAKSRAPETTHVTTPPVPAQRAPIFTLPEYRKATGAGPFPANAVALTIDDGPHPIWTPKILHLLDQYHVPAMFCMIGNQVLGHENIAKMVTAAGHQLANHTWSHPTSLGKKTGEAVRKEILRAQEKIHDTTGQAPKVFRSPGGVWSPTVLQQSAAAGLLPLDWTNDPKDWSRPGVGKIEHTLLAARPGQILLCHDGGGDRSQTYNALKVVLPQLKSRGLHFVAL